MVPSTHLKSSLVRIRMILLTNVPQVDGWRGEFHIKRLELLDYYPSNCKIPEPLVIRRMMNHGACAVLHRDNASS